jgi:hypothetical protein
LVLLCVLVTGLLALVALLLIWWRRHSCSPATLAGASSSAACALEMRPLVDTRDRPPSATELAA